MQIYDINLMLGGDRHNVLPKSGVTAAEIMVLKSIHGNQSVTDISKTDMDKRQHAEELDRLKSIYPQKVVVGLFGQGFGGVKLPVKIQDFTGDVAEVSPDEEMVIHQS
jgi:hypothetical protein